MGITFYTSSLRHELEDARQRLDAADTHRMPPHLRLELQRARDIVAGVETRLAEGEGQ